MTDTPMNDSISAQVTALPGLPMKDLWALWDAQFPRRPAHTNRHYGNRVWPTACRPSGARRYLVERGAQFSKIQQAGRGTECHLVPGTVLVREWDGREYRVTVTADLVSRPTDRCRRARAAIWWSVARSSRRSSKPDAAPNAIWCPARCWCANGTGASTGSPSQRMASTS
jgi:hypothetical protein